jgi:hypothetical protein
MGLQPGPKGDLHLREISLRLVDKQPAAITSIFSGEIGGFVLESAHDVPLTS